MFVALVGFWQNDLGEEVLSISQETSVCIAANPFLLLPISTSCDKLQSTLSESTMDSTYFSQDYETEKLKLPAPNYQFLACFSTNEVHVHCNKNV